MKPVNQRGPIANGIARPARGDQSEPALQKEVFDA
jgi:hypothetical protein